MVPDRRECLARTAQFAQRSTGTRLTDQGQARVIPYEYAWGSACGQGNQIIIGQTTLCFSSSRESIRAFHRHQPADANPREPRPRPDLQGS